MREKRFATHGCLPSVDSPPHDVRSIFLAFLGLHFGRLYSACLGATCSYPHSVGELITLAFYEISKASKCERVVLATQQTPTCR